MVLGTYQRLTLNLVRLVNSQREIGAATRETLVRRDVRRAFCEGARLAAERGLTAGTLAEVSMRLPGGKFLINRADAWPVQLTDNDLAVTSINKEWVVEEATLARHVEWHRAVYTSTEAGAILLCQPVAATVVAASSVEPRMRWLADAPSATGDLTRVSPESGAIGLAARQHGVLLITGHGVLAWGEDLLQAIARAETAARWCEVTLAATRAAIG